MKKIMLLTIFAGLVTACTVDDDRTETDDPNAETIAPECVVDLANPPAVMGSSWARSNFFIEPEIDGNGDGIFTNDIEVETTCAADVMTFKTDFTAGNPTYHLFSLEVIDDGNGNLSQTHGCLIGDGLFPTYTQDGNVVNFCYFGEIAFTGTLSNNDQTLTFNFTNEEISFLGLPNTYLKQDGSVETLQGDVTIVYTRL